MIISPASFVGEGMAESAEKALSLGIAAVVGCLIALAICILELILLNKATDQLKSDNKNTMPHIVMIVLGVLGGDIFYLLGGIFGVVHASK